MDKVRLALRISLLVACLGLSTIPLILNIGEKNSLAAPNDCPPPPAPPPTAEPLWVEPVTSPTTLVTQTLYVSLGRGRAITIDSEAGTVAITGTFTAYQPASATIPLLPRTTHHLTVTGLVEYSTGCFYTLHTHNDRYGHSLIIVQITPTLYLPLVLQNVGGSSLAGCPVLSPDNP